jgi:hypothetical protein
MKWERALHHLEDLAWKCAELDSRPSSIHPLRATRLWAFGDILGEPRDLESITVAVAVDLPADDVPWLSEPPGSQQWANATRLAKNPIRAWWRSASVPVWNHLIDRPALVWDAESGVAEKTLLALKEGSADDVRAPAPTAAGLQARLDDEFAVSLRALRERTRTYGDRRWSPGKIETLADPLWHVTEGYLEILDARGGAQHG